MEAMIIINISFSSLFLLPCQNLFLDFAWSFEILKQLFFKNAGHFKFYFWECLNHLWWNDKKFIDFNFCSIWLVFILMCVDFVISYN